MFATKPHKCSPGWIAAILLLANPPFKKISVSGQGTPVDLSQDLETAASYNLSPGAIAVNEVAAADPFIRTALVLEDGKIVSSYVREDVDPDKPYPLWSATKSAMGLLVGLMLDDGSLTSLDETLGEIFSNATFWADLSEEDAVFRKAVTVEELITMSSGFLPPTGQNGGQSLAEAVTTPTIGTKGEFNYLPTSNILSYVVLTKTGKTPRQYLAEKVLPSLSIEDSDIVWLQNEDGVETSFHNLFLTPHQMAKFGQLYQSRGVTEPGGNPIVSPEWIEASITVQMEVPTEKLRASYADAQYGYLLWSGVGVVKNIEDTSGIWCAFGGGGQDICGDSNGRISVQQRDYNPQQEEGREEGNAIIASVALDPELSLDTPLAPTAPAPGPTAPTLTLAPTSAPTEFPTSKPSPSSSAETAAVYQPLLVAAVAAGSIIRFVM